MRIASVGHAVFAATLIGLGILGLSQGDFTQVWQPVPRDLPAREALVYLCAILCVACGAGLLWQRTAAIAARVLLVLFVLLTVLFKLRFIVLAPLQEGSYQTCGENAAIIAGVWVLYAWFATDWDRQRLGFATGDRGVRIARILYALAMIAFGLSHFVYLQLTAPLVPTWLLWPVFWAYVTGGTYLLAGAAILAGKYARLAALLSTVQMAGFTLLVWIPIVIAGRMTPFQWGELVVSWTLTASGWVVADSWIRPNSMQGNPG
ncbi:MAG: DoxX family protein [Dokdonella sp.]